MRLRPVAFTIGDVSFRMRYAVGPLVVMWLLASGAVVCAQEVTERCGHAGRPWVSLVFVGEVFSAAWRRSVAEDLRAGLRLRGIDVCELGADGSEPPLALVQVSSASREEVSVSIDVHDAITEKRVMRDVDLRHVTADGTGLSVAQGAEELLRASWAELALEDAPAPAVEPPPEVTRAVESKPSARAARVHELGAMFAVEHHGGGATLLGADAGLALWFGDRIGTEVAAGVRDGLQESASGGRIDTSALAMRIDMLAALVPRHGGYDLLAKVGTELLRVQFQGVGDAHTLGLQREGFILSARATLAARAAVTSALRIGIELGSGLPLRAAIATEAGHAVTATTGLEVHGALGASVVF